MLRNLREYIYDDELKITILKDRVNVINYDKLRDIDDNEISFTKDKRKIKILGEQLKLNKLLDDEILVIGTIKKVELDNE